MNTQYEDFKKRTEYTKEQCRESFPTILAKYTQKSKSGNIVCNFCGSGTGKHHTGAMKYYEDTKSVKCHKCGYYGDVFSYWADIHKLDVKKDFPQVFNGVCNDLNISIPSNDISHRYVKSEERKVNIMQNQEVTQTNDNNQLRLDTIHNDIIEAQKNADMFDYLLSRGIPINVQRRFGVGYIPNWTTVDTRISANFDENLIPDYKKSPRLIIPTSDYSYLSRDIRPNHVLSDNAKEYTKIKMGKVHILNLDSLKNGTPIFITEGEITMMSAIAVGHEAISLGSVGMAKPFLEEKYYEIVGKGSKYNRPVLILAFDGDKAGAEATIKAMAICKKKNIPAIKLSKNFYENGKYNDLNDILRDNPELLKNKLEKEFKKAQNFNYNHISEVIDKEQVREDLPVFVEPKYNQLTGKYSYTINCSKLAKYIMEHETFKFDRQDSDGTKIKYIYDKKKGIYTQIFDDEIGMLIKEYIDQFDEEICQNRHIKETLSLINHTRGNLANGHFNEEEDLVFFEDCVYNFRTEEITEHSPDHLATIQLSANLQGQSFETPTFDHFMNTFTGGNKDNKQLLMEFMGLTLSNVFGYRFKQMLFLLGSGNSGKTTLRNLITKILGLNNICSSSLNQLEQRFGTSNIFNKRLIGSADMDSARIKELSIAKSISGGDVIDIEFKNRGAFSYVYKGVAWFCCNQLPEISYKHQEEVYDRMIIFPCNNVIPKNQQDKHLVDKLYEERTGIIIKCLKALKQAVKRGYKFTQPNTCNEARNQYMTENNPVALFMQECVTKRPNKDVIQDKCTTKKFYDVFKAWCNTYGFFAMNIIQFRKMLAKYLHVDNIKELVKRTAQNTYYLFTLNNHTKQDFIQAYGVDNICSEKLLA